MQSLACPGTQRPLQRHSLNHATPPDAPVTAKANAPAQNQASGRRAKRPKRWATAANAMQLTPMTVGRARECGINGPSTPVWHPAGTIAPIVNRITPATRRVALHRRCARGLRPESLGSPSELVASRAVRVAWSSERVLTAPTRGIFPCMLAPGPRGCRGERGGDRERRHETQFPRCEARSNPSYRTRLPQTPPPRFAVSVKGGPTTLELER